MDITRCARSATLACWVRLATTQVAAVGALPLGFTSQLCMVQSKFAAAGSRDVEGARVFALLLVPIELLLFLLFGLERCLLTVLQLFSACWVVLLVLILHSGLFGAGDTGC